VTSRARLFERAGVLSIIHDKAPSKESPVMTRNALALSVLSAAIALVSSAATAADRPESEKCYGVVKAGANDCETATNSCAGTSAQDGQKDAWVLVPKGLCEKLVGGSLEPGA
jgi:uncharacterized membrane protein